jgi:mycolipenoyl-CoA---2-(long-chain-fatty acyl)-trehalose mycolipenoyltransferase / long-chain-acyl-CoA---trehalose acyltransferase
VNVFALGKVTIGPVQDWVPDQGTVVSWDPSEAALAKARQAPVSDVPASYMQTEHLRTFSAHAQQGLDMARLCITAWDIPGRCDIRAMTYVINTHLRRHDTYRSWFEYTDAEHIVRRTIPNPTDIEFVPTRHGEMTPAEWHSRILATPNPLEWDCFRFMLIQKADHFTFCLCVDHLYIDAMFIGMIFTEIHMMYVALARGGAPLRLPASGSYLEYCGRQHQSLSALTLDSPQVRAWIEFLENNDGTLPECRLPLGDSAPTELMSATLLDERQTAAFESACLAAGARFSGGVFACAALAEHELTGAETYYGIIATDTRSTPADFVTTGWYTGFLPITVPVAATFGETARAAQKSFDSGKDLANVPWGRVLELAPWLRRPQRRVPLLFFLDAGIPPLSALVNSHLGGLNARIYHDGGIPAQFDIRVNRFENETHVIVLFPNNPVARESVTRYIAALKSIYVRVAEGRDPAPGLRDVAVAGFHFERSGKLTIQG